MREPPEKIQALKNRWLLDHSFGLMRPALIEALRALQDGDRNWPNYLCDFSNSSEDGNAHSVCGANFSSFAEKLPQFSFNPA